MAGHMSMSCDALQTVVLSAFASVCGEEKFQYLSGPVTGGRRFLDWYRAEGRAIPLEARKPAQRAKVIAPNIAALIEAARAERGRGRPTIEPGSFEADFDAWGQPEFYALWDTVIARHASRVKFLNGWQFSAGCVFEYESAQRHGLPRVDELDEDLPAGHALKLIDDAVGELEKGIEPGDSTDKLGELAANIGKYRAFIAAKG